MITAVVVGDKELQDKLSRIATQDANTIARAVLRSGASLAASNIRRHIPKSIRPRQSDRGIGTSLKKGPTGQYLSKIGTGVGKSQKVPDVRGGRGKRPGVGVSGRNLHWFALGTADRYTGQGRVSRRNAVFARQAGRLTSTGGRHYTGRLVKEKFRQFVKSYGAAAVSARMKQRFDQLVSKLAQTGTKLSRADEFQGLLD